MILHLLLGVIAGMALDEGLRAYTRHRRDRMPWGDRIDDAFCGFCGSDDVSDQRDYGARRRP